MEAVLRRSGDGGPRQTRESVVTIGNFDGLHLGHQRLIKVLMEEKLRLHSGATTVVLSFYPHPGVVLGKAASLPQITTLRQELRILGELEVDTLHLLHFTKKFSALSAEDFIRQVLVENLNARTLIIGPDARVGHNREGDPNFIRSEFQRLGRRCVEVEFVPDGDAPISSRRIRDEIQLGQVESARRLLGRPFVYSSRVIHGERRGRSIGFPTANLLLNAQVLPKTGVYAGRVAVHGKTFGCVTNIGTRPTFDGKKVSVETHLLDYAGPEVYGARLEVEFWFRIRDERKFASPEELRTQIAADVTEARRRL